MFKTTQLESEILLIQVLWYKAIKPMSNSVYIIQPFVGQIGHISTILPFPGWQDFSRGQRQKFRVLWEEELSCILLLLFLKLYKICLTFL